MNASRAFPSLVYDPDDVAGLFGLSVDRFRALRPKLEAAGFPKRLPVLSARWSKPAVDHWIATNGATYQPLMDAEDLGAGAIEAARQALEDRYAGAAA